MPSDDIVHKIEVDYPNVPPGAKYRTRYTFNEIEDRLHAGIVWLPCLNKDGVPTLLNLDRVLRIRKD